jgi:hypothetical protein
MRSGFSLRVTVMGTVLGHVTSCSLAKNYQNFGDTHCLHIQGRRLRQKFTVNLSEIFTTLDKSDLQTKCV